jgi:NTP pyrophosphatase (non-canonical NTP hydrolase)
MIDLNKYAEFVEAITSPASNDLPSFINSVHRVEVNSDVNVPLLLTGAMGMCGEAGEFSEIIKKVVFHGKELTQEVHDHLVKELGDVIWYWTNTCRALGVSQEEVIVRNMEKLMPRYPGGVFSIDASENRKEGDI